MKKLSIPLLSILIAGTAAVAQQVDSAAKQQHPGTGQTTLQLAQALESAVSKKPGSQGAYMDPTRLYLLSFPDIADGTARTDRLVSDLAFRKLIRKNFNSIILGNDEVSKIGRYANVDISDKPAFSFSPVVIETNPETKRFQHIFSLNFSGKLNELGHFELADFRDLRGRFSWKYILQLTFYSTVDKPSNLSKYKHRLREAVENMTKEYESKFKAVDNSVELSTERGKDEKTDEKRTLKKKFIQEYTDKEIELADEFWKNRHFFWLSTDIDFFGYDQVSHVQETKLPADFSVVKDRVFTPGAELGLNYHVVSKSRKSLLLTAAVGTRLRHSLSEVFEPSEFQNYKDINDSTMRLLGKSNVFVVPFDELSEKWVFDWKVRGVALTPFGSSSVINKIGISIGFSRKGLVGTESNASLYRTEVGLVFPMLNSKGEAAINVEIFKRWDRFSNFKNDDSNVLGFRFNVPISN
jgi:hypothetical protein